MLKSQKEDSVIKVINRKIEEDLSFFKKISDNPLDEFELTNYDKVLKKSKQIERDILEAFKNKNQLLVDTIFATLDRELSIIKAISTNQREIRVLQHFDHLRGVLSDTLQKVMKSGDHYITLASLDFWTLKPFDPEDFLEVNFEAVFDASKFVDRVMIIDKKFILCEDLNANDLLKFNDFVNLITKIRGSRYELKYEYSAKIKIFFYFHSNYKTIRDFLDSVIIINAKLNELMFIKVQKLSNIADNIANKLSDNPIIKVSFFEFNSLEPVNVEPHDIIQIIKHIKNSVENKTKLRFENQEEYNRLVELNKYLSEFRKYFEKISTIYNVEDGLRNENVDLNKCDFYDVEMLYQYYNELRKAKPELFTN